MEDKVKLRFKSYEFDYNPKSISVKNERHMLKLNSPLSGSVIQDLGANATVVTGSGTFFGDNAKEQYNELYSLFLNKQSGVLNIPGIKPFFAYFSSFSAERKAGPNVISYNFKFIEDCQKSKGRWHDVFNQG